MKIIITESLIDEEKGLKQFEELCQTYHLQYKGNCASKIVRVLSTLKAGL